MKLLIDEYGLTEAEATEALKVAQHRLLPLTSTAIFHFVKVNGRRVLLTHARCDSQKWDLTEDGFINRQEYDLMMVFCGKAIVEGTQRMAEADGAAMAKCWTCAMCCCLCTLGMSICCATCYTKLAYNKHVTPAVKRALIEGPTPEEIQAARRLPCALDLTAVFNPQEMKDQMKVWGADATTVNPVADPEVMMMVSNPAKKVTMPHPCVLQPHGPTEDKVE